MSTYKILIVEDEPGLRSAVAQKLSQNSNYEILEAANGQEGLDKALNHHPDLILLDHLMPVMDGTTALKKLREDSWGANVNVIMMTNMTEIDTMNESLKAGVDDYIMKVDIKLDELSELVSDKLEEKTAA
jgi:DNA-binding response OmpR family regulator